MNPGLKAGRLDQRGEGMILSLYSLLVITVVLMIGIEAAGYTMAVWKLRQVCSETLNLMKIENGMNSRTEAGFHELMEDYGLQGFSFRLKGTPCFVQRGDLLEFEAESSYPLSCLRPLGTQWAVPLHIKVRGLAQTFIRGG
jgi:hypothetical protein